MNSHQTPLENRHAQTLRVGEVGGYTRPEHPGPVSTVTASLQHASPETHRRLSPESRGGILQAPWPIMRLQPTPWIAVAFPNLLAARLILFR